MKKCGILNEKKKADDSDNLQFRTQFVDPLVETTVNEFREAFGLNNMEDGPLNALALEVDE